VKKRKRVEKGKKDEQDKKKIAKRKGKKKVQDDDEDYELEEMQYEKKKLEKEFKSLRAKTTIPGKLPYFVLKILDTKRMEVSFPSGSKLKITPKKIWEVLGIPMGKNKLVSDTLREYYDELLKAFKALFNNNKFITTTDLSKQIQRTNNTDFMFQMNYLMLFSNCMIHCDNNSRLNYFVIKNIKSTDIINDFDWCKFIWDHIQTSKNGWDNTVLLMMKRKWPAIKNWTNKDVLDRENLEMLKGKIGLVELIKDNDKQDENEKDAEKRKLRVLVYETIEEKFQNVLKEKTELEHLLKEYTEMDELFSGDERLTLYVKKFKEEFTTGFRKDEERAGTSGVGNGDGNKDGVDNNEVDVEEENKPTEMGIDAEISVKEATKEKEADKASEMRQAVEKEAAEKEAAAKEKQEAGKIAAAKKKEQAEKLAAAKNEKAKKLAGANKEQAEKLAATKKKKEAEKLAATNKEQAEKLAATKKKEEAEKLAATKKK
ncbi:hypothetical protein Tco_1389932, partial [Tanacetum coccineum]